MFQGKIKVLLLEDNPGNVLLIQEMFKEEIASRFELASVARLADGIKRLSEQEFDAVILDLNLPDSSGIATARRLKQNAPNLPIVILTALADESVALEALQIGMEDYLVKGQITGALLTHALRYAIERKHVEKALRESELKYRSLVEQSLLGILIVQDERIVYMNNLMAEKSGYSVDEAISLSPEQLRELIYPDDRAVVWNRMLRRLAGDQEPARNECRFVVKDGSIYWADVHTSVIEYLGRPAIQMFIVDITERKHSEEALKKSEEKYRNLVEREKDVICSVDPLGFVKSINSAVEMWGYTADEVLKMNFRDLIAPEWREVTATVLQARLLETGEYVGETVAIRKDGEKRPIEYSAVVIQKEGKYAGAQAIVRDISERKKAEEDIKRHAKRIEALYAIAQVISQASTIDAMLGEALDKVCDVMDMESGGIFMLDCDDRALKLKACKGLPESIVLKVSTIMVTEQGVEGLMDLTEPITDKIREVVTESGRKAIVAAPFFRGKDLQGLIVVLTTQARTFSRDDLKMLTAIANEIAVGINNVMLLERTRELSVTDELTGLYNRRHFFEVLDVEMNRADRTNRPFSLAMLDLDGFKEYNDKFGHITGDAALQSLSQMLKESIRKSDLAFRYGGDEFALILPTADAERAKKIIRRARSIWQKSPMTQPPVFGGHVDFSTGIAEYPENAESADGLVFLADAALYQAKRKGGHGDKLVSELSTLSTGILDMATQDQVYALAATVDARDPYTYGHSQRVAEIAKLIGRAIGMAEEDLAKIHAAALLHDIGKVGVPDSILAKMGKPTNEEWRVIKRHSAEGARIVNYVKELASIVPVILHHHEWYDGTGYPDGLKGIDIPVGARIISIADAYDTMVTKRPYRKVVSPKEACEELKRFAGAQFDPALVGVWCKLVG